MVNYLYNYQGIISLNFAPKFLGVLATHPLPPPLKGRGKIFIKEGLRPPLQHPLAPVGFCGELFTKRGGSEVNIIF
jgi:hypothetical protein